jgi:programmed cell death 6-interacting protein
LNDTLQEKNKQFLASRKDDPNVKARERTLQKLDIAYHKYKEIVGNLEEGMKVRLAHKKWLLFMF